MGRKKIDIQGQKFGDLIVLQETSVRSVDGQIMWSCQCVCKNIILVSGQNLRYGRQKSCGCKKGEYIRQKRRLAKGEAAQNALYVKYYVSAKDRNIFFKLPKAKFFKLIKQSCFYCGALPSQEYKQDKYYGSCIYNGIDRTDNTIGYIEENCVPCCKTCNRMKRKLSIDEFRNHIQGIYFYWIKDVQEKHKT